MKKGLSSNILKIIAIIIMILDHVASYFSKSFNQESYYILRNIGRIAMPIFVYILIQGYFYTKDRNKFIFRIFILATFTQIVLFILGYINFKYFSNYYSTINNYLGILYSYVLSLILIKLIDEKKVINKLSENKNLLLRINLIIIIIITYLNFKIEFDMQVPFLMIEIYLIEKLFMVEDKLLLKQEHNIKLKLVYLSLIVIALLISTKFVGYSAGAKEMVILSIIFIGLYNGNRGKKNKLIQTLFYLVFPLQHIILYMLAMMV